MCLEGHYSDQIINVIQKTIDLVGTFVNSVIMQKDDDESEEAKIEDALQDCDTEQIHKLK